MSEEQQGQETVLVDQLGVEPDYLTDDLYDYRILTVLRPSTETPDTYKSVLYSCIHDSLIKARKNGQYVSIMQLAKENDLRLKTAIGGRARRDIINGEQVKRGVAVTTNKEISQPGLMDKLFNREKVRQYDRQEAESVGLE